MKTYNDIHSKENMDWNVWLDSVDADECNMEQAIAAKDLAGSWVTCACGNLCDAIPRVEHGAPWKIGEHIDEKLAELGMSFFGAITYIRDEIRDFGIRTPPTDEAREILAAIEKRSCKILSEMGINLKVE